MSCSPERPAGTSRRTFVRLAAGSYGISLRADDLRQMKPVDQAGDDPALAALLGRIRDYTARHDSARLESLMLPDFRVEFDSGKGPQAFRRHWRSASAASPLWTVLERLMALGGTFYSSTLFAVPYVYTRFPIDLDPLAHVVSLGSGVGVLDKPEAGARRLNALDYTIAPLARPFKPPVLLAQESYLEITLPESGTCFVSAADVYSPAGHRAFFEKRKGQWRWISLAAATLNDPPVLAHPEKRS